MKKFSIKLINSGEVLTVDGNSEQEILDLAQYKDNISEISEVLHMTVGEFAEIHGAEYIEASSLIKFLARQGIVKEVGKRPQASGRGKPSSIFEFCKEATIAFWPDSAPIHDAVEQVLVNIDRENKPEDKNNPMHVVAA